MRIGFGAYTHVRGTDTALGSEGRHVVRGHLKDDRSGSNFLVGEARDSSGIL